MVNKIDMVKIADIEPGVASVRFADGWTREEWLELSSRGLVKRSGLLSPQETEALRADCELFESVGLATQRRVEGGFRRTLAISERFMRLVCDPRLLGPAYDLYGEQTSLHGFDLFVRPPEGLKRHGWHFDGPRRLPYSTFAPKLPLVLKLGVWLTDVPARDWGAYQYAPGSHLDPPHHVYGQEIELEGQEDLIVRAGDVTLHHADLWHRVSPNRSQITRYNLFITYAPAWIAPRERFDGIQAPRDLPQLPSLLRAYDDLTHRIKPPTEEVPLHAHADRAVLRGARLGGAPLPDWSAP